jgi:hypothetical protein
VKGSLIAGVLLLSACFIPTDDHNLGSGPALGPIGGGAGGSQVCVDLLLYGTVCTTRFPVICGGVRCAEGEHCCQTTGSCVAPGSSACPNPPTTEPNHLPSCGSDADCASDSYCVPDEFRLTSSGPQAPRCVGLSAHCQPRRNCAYCSLPGDPRCQVCGCDGRTYASPQEACVAGVTAPNPGPCGVTSSFDGEAFTVSCGIDEQCTPGAKCCALTGRCFDPSQPWRCELRSDSSILNCNSHEECNPPQGGGSGSETPTRLCQADGCDGPGLCSTRWPPSSCSGEVRTVCGCDGVTYVNECWARSGGSRVAHAGNCP